MRIKVITSIFILVLVTTFIGCKSMQNSKGSRESGGHGSHSGHSH